MPSYVVNLQGGGQMTVNATDPASAVTNVIAQGGTPAANAPIITAGGVTSSGAPAAAGSSSGTPQFNKDLTLAFVVLVLAGIAIAISSWGAGAKFVQWGLAIAIVIVVLKDSQQFTNFLDFLSSGNTGLTGG